MYSYLRRHVFTVVITLIVGLLSLNTYMVLDVHKSAINLVQAQELTTELQRVAEALDRAEPIDTFFVFLIHNSPYKWSDRSVGDRIPYTSAVYFWTNEGILNPIANRQNIPFVALRHMANTIAGECSSASYTNGGHDLGIADWEGKFRLITICPIQRNGVTTGFMGTMKIDGDPTSRNERIASVKRYSQQINRTFDGN